MMNRRRSAPGHLSGPVEEKVVTRTLRCGLHALVLAEPLAPVVVADLFIPAGSTCDPPGLEGTAHFVEHMVFKGTPRRPKGWIDRAVAMVGGQTNAETDFDLTHFWFELPADCWELALEVEIDRMAHARFDPAEVELERKVILEELAADLDSPLGRLDRHHQSLSYLRHPYRNPILGWPESLKRLDAESLKAFHRRFHRPETATLVVVGDLEPAAALDRIEAHWDTHPWPARPKVEPEVADDHAKVPTWERSGRCEFVLEDREPILRGLYGWRTVPWGHPDGPALTVAADLLGGGRGARLWRRLVERDRLVASLDVSHDLARLDGQFLIGLEAPNDADRHRIDAAIHQELAKLADRGPTPEELDRARRRLDAAWRWSRQDLAGLAVGIGYAAVLGHWTDWIEDHRAACRVGPDQIRAALRAHLTNDRLTVGWVVPGTARRLIRPLDPVFSDDAVSPPPPLAPTPPDNQETDHAEQPESPIGSNNRVALRNRIRFVPKRVVLSNGLRVCLDPRPEGSGTVALEFHVETGPTRERLPGAAFLAGRALEETLKLGREYGRERAVEVIEERGGVLALGTTGASLRLRSEDLDLGLEVIGSLIAADLRKLEPARLAWIKERLLADLETDAEDPAFQVETAFRALVYGRHPHARDPRGLPRSIKNLDRGTLHQQWRDTARPDNAILAASGDFDPAQLIQQVETLSNHWIAPPLKQLAIPAPPRLLAKTKIIHVCSEQAHVVLGHLGIRRCDPDFAALVVADQVLSGGGGFADRLNATLRDERGLVYSVGGGIADSADLEPGLFRVGFATDPLRLAEAVATTRDLIASFVAQPPRPDELERAREFLKHAWVFEFQGDDQRADRLVEMERHGLPANALERWLDHLDHLDPDQIHAAIRRHIHPDRLVQVVGQPHGWDRPAAK
jgi:zinc protease